MSQLMLYIHCAGAALLIFFSFRSFRGGLGYLEHFRSDLACPASNFIPFATVIAPCRGAERGLGENLKAVVGQDYPRYEVIFVVDDINDPAVAVIEAVPPAGSARTRLVEAPRALDCGQKVANLREAVAHASRDSEVFVFVDSDARPGKDWLRSLVGAVEDERIGAATGYRWFASERPGLAAEIRAAWNASIASALGPNTATNFCWGGSTAIRRDVFERLRINEKWRGTLSDDFAVTRAMRAAGMPIVFVPRALSLSPGGCTWRELLEFTNRQMKITRVYAPRLWVMSLVGSALFVLVIAASLLIAFNAEARSFGWFASLFTLVAVGALSIGKAWLRFKAVNLVLGRGEAALRNQFPFQMTLWLPAQVLFLINSIAALFSRKIRWRGTEYLMVSAEETRVL